MSLGRSNRDYRAWNRAAPLQIDLFEEIQYLRFNASPADAIAGECVLRDVLDAYVAFDIPFLKNVTERVSNWHQNDLRDCAQRR